MKRIVLLTVAAVFATVAGTVAWRSQRSSDRNGASRAAKADSVWYHASDVAVLAKTGRPQLVEFFHPG
jgi:hypothetical protein